MALFSWTEQLRKPAPELYRKALDRLGLQAAEALYIGDGGSHELSGAEACGLRALRICHHPGDPEAHLQFDPDLAWRGTEVGTLTEVLSFIS
jgi:putative hydrolase of the HAD superfamily